MTENDRDWKPASRSGETTGRSRKVRRSNDPDHLSGEELERLESQSDALISLIGHVQRHRPDSPVFDDPKFLEWYCSEQRMNHEERPDGEAMVRSESSALARRIQESLQADRLGVNRVNHPPLEIQHESPTTTSQMVERLRGTSQAALADLSVAAGAGRALWDGECDTSVELPPHLFGGRYLALRVAGDSMTPLMHSGDVVLVKLGPEVRPDCVVVARLPDHSYVVKRVGKVTPMTLELVSLNSAFPSMQVLRSSNTVLGMVVLRWCAHSG